MQLRCGLGAGNDTNITYVPAYIERKHLHVFYPCTFQRLFSASHQFLMASTSPALLELDAEIFQREDAIFTESDSPCTSSPSPCISRVQPDDERDDDLSLRMLPDASNEEGALASSRFNMFAVNA